MLLGRLLPRKGDFFLLFRKHADVIVLASRELVALMEEGADIQAKARLISELEHQADDIAHQCIELLHQTFITPIERDDIFHLISKLDDIADEIEAAAECMALYKIRTITPEAKVFATILLKAAEEIAQALAKLDNMKNATAIRSHCIEINTLENQADTVHQEGIAKLFDQDDVKLIIKWKEIYDNLEAAADRCEDVSNIIEGILLEYA